MTAPAATLSDRLEELARRVEALSGPNYAMDHQISVAIGRPENWHGSQLPAYTASTDAAMSLLPETATNHNLLKFSGGWTFRFNDTAQKMGARAATEEIARMQISIGSPAEERGAPWVQMEKAIAEHWLEFVCLKAATPALAICAAALRALATLQDGGEG